MEINAYLTTGQAWWVTFLILGAVLLVVSACSLFVGWAVRDAGPGVGRGVMLAFPAILVLWAGGALATSLSVVLEFAWFVPFASVPIVLGALLSFLPAFAAFLPRIPTHWLIALQSYRVLGGLFLFPYMTSGILAPGFAWPAGVGDVLTGIAAPVVAWGVMRDPVRWRGAFYAWTVFGIADLIVAPLSAAIFSFGVDGQDMTFAITAIPLFLGPPFGILIHVMTWRSFELRHGGDRGRRGKPESSSARVEPRGAAL